MKNDHEWPARHTILVGVTYFCYSVTAALLLQKLVLPMLGSLHASNGLLNNDAIFFHNQALALAELIKKDGWSAWSMWPAGGGSGNVAALAALYVLFGPDPTLLIPINAALHALSGLLIFKIGRRLWPGRVGVWGGLAASALFVTFPSALVWYGQIHKDSFSIAGVLLIVYALLRAERGDRRGVIAGAGYAAAGIALVFFVRPYYLKLLLVASLAAWLTALAATLIRRPAGARRLIGPAMVLALVATGVLASRILLSGASRYAMASLEGTLYANLPLAGFGWRQSPWLPAYLDQQAELVGKTRYGLAQYNRSIAARTLIDGDAALQSAGDIISYAPRALQVAAFAPFPSDWLAKTSLPVLLGVGETAVWYLLAPGLLVFQRRRRSLGAAMVLVFACALLTMIGTFEPNVGTLFRLRYTYLQLLMLMGALGWTSLWLERGPARKPS
ncbi:MAG: hypothetical protein HY926_05955 [Elusimicrobia bacterium]|nr:hypothetical protein [Elusimicrobiota bacterium]